MIKSCHGAFHQPRGLLDSCGARNAIRIPRNRQRQRTTRHVHMPVNANPNAHLHSKWSAPLLCFDGYATVARASVQALVRSGVQVEVEPFNTDPNYMRLLDAQSAGDWAQILKQRVGPGVHVTYNLPVSPTDQQNVFATQRLQHPGHLAYVGASMLETDRVPASWVRACQSMDEIWVPTHFNRDTFAACGIEAHKLAVVPMGLDMQQYNPLKVQPLEINGRKGFMFLSVFEWTLRKGWDVLLAGYIKAFSASDDVCLVIKAHGGRKKVSIRQQVDEYLRTLGRSPESAPSIIVISQKLSPVEMQRLYRAADAFVLPTRGEGWGLPYMESMALGVPAIATGWSGHTEFMTAENSYLLDYQLSPVSEAAWRDNRNSEIYKGHYWAEPNLDDLIATMRAVHANPAAAQARGQIARAHLEAHFNWDAPARAMLPRLRALTEQQPAHQQAVRPQPMPGSDTRPASKWAAPLFTYGDQGWLARSFVRSLDAAGHDIGVRTLGKDPEFLGKLSTPARMRWDVMQTAPDQQAVYVAQAQPTVGLSPQNVYAELRRNNPGHLAYAAVAYAETEQAPAHWAQYCKSMDEIWTPGEFSRAALIAGGVEPQQVHALQPGIDCRLYDPARTAPIQIDGQQGYTFLSVCEWTLRQGWDVLLRAYVQAFDRSDNVCLLLRPPRGDTLGTAYIEEQLDAFLATLGCPRSQAPRIIVPSGFLGEENFPALYASANAFVLPTRGDAWSVPLMEAMAMGLPTVATGWGGHTAFMLPDNSHLLDYELLPVSDAARSEGQGLAMYQGLRWAEPDAAQLARTMRTLFENPEAGAQRGALARQHMAAHFTPQATAAQLGARIAALHSRRPAAAHPLAARSQHPAAASTAMRVLLVGHPDSPINPGPETSALLAQRDSLRAAGMQADVSVDWRPDGRAYDVAHVHGIQAPDVTAQQIHALQADGVPVVLSPHHWDQSESLWAEMAIGKMLSESSEDTDTRAYLRRIGESSLLVEGRTRYNLNPASLVYLHDQRDVTNLARHLAPDSFAELALLNRQLAAAHVPATVVRAGVPAQAQPAAPDAFTERYGMRDFVIVLGSVEPRNNQLLLLYALRNTDLPVVIVGPVPYPEYLRKCEQAAAPTTLFLERLPAGMLHSALAAARVFALPGWWQSAPSAALLAALSGCSIVLGDRGGEKEYLGADAYYCDPASVQSIGAAVLRAYAGHGERTAQRAALAQRIAAQYSAALQAQQLAELYRGVQADSMQNPAANAKLAIQSTAKIAELDGYHVEAEAQLLALLQADPANTAAARQLARLHLRHGRLTEGAAMLQQTLRGDPHDFDSVHRLGAALRQLGRLDEAAALLESALDFNTGRTELVLVLAQVRVDQRKFLEAEKLLAQLVEDLPNDPHVLVAQGDCVLARGKADDALFCYERALHNVPNYKPAAQRLLHLQTAAAARSDAVNLGGAVAAATAAAAAEALILRQLQDADLTTVLHQHKPELDRNFVRLMRLVAETAQGDGRGALAAQLFKLADEMVHIHGPRVRELDDTSTSADALFGAVQQAEELLTARDIAGAHSALRSALQLAPDDTWLSVANGLAMIRQADFAGAQRAFAQAVLVNPRFAPAYARLAGSLLELGRTHEAGQAVQRALALDRTHPQALRMLATLNATAQAAPRSARSYADVLTKLPFDLDALLQLGDFYAQAGDWSSARAVYTRAVDIDSSSAPAADRLRQAKAHTGPLPQPDFEPDNAQLMPTPPAAQVVMTAALPTHHSTLTAELEAPALAPAAQPLGANTTTLALRWGGSILDYSGYSWLSRQILRGLDQPQLALSLEPYAVNAQLLAELPLDLVRRWQSMLGWHAGNPVYVCFHPPVLWNGDDVYAHYRARNPHCSAAVGFTMFETDRLPQGWAAALNQMDEVWVPSQFNFETFAHAGVAAAKLHVVPCGIDAAAYAPGTVQPLPVSGRRGFNFLSVFQWHRRKGWDVLLRAYLSAFQPGDDVCLMLRVHPDAGDAQPIREQIDAHVRAIGYDPQHIPDIVLLTDFIPEGDMPRLYAAADAFVLPTRGEGWGIPFMEAMASALPVIGTRWSSQLDFMNDANSYLIDVAQLVPVCSEQTAVNPFYTADQLWAEPCAAHTAQLMRMVFTERAAARTTGARARASICRDWTLERTAAWINARVAILAGQRSTPVAAAPIAESLSHPLVTAQAAAPSAAETAGGSPIPAEQSTDEIALAAAPLAAVRWHAPVFEPSGYADDARALTTQLAAQGHCVLLEPVGNPVPAFVAQLGPDTQAALAALTATHLPATFCSVMHVPAYAFVRDPQATFNIGRTMFETEGLPANWVARCNQMDEIWVPGEFNRRTFMAAGVQVPVHIVPMGVDCARFHPAAEPHAVAQLPGLKFLSVFAWQQRKGWDLLLRAWARSFRRHERVHLILQVMGAQTAAADIRASIERFCATELGTSLSDLAPVHILTEPLYANLPGLYAAADAFVLPTRGEGWGRPYMEAMATGLPVVGTRWGGNLAFMTDFNSYLIDSSGLAEIGPDIDVPYFAGLHWASPSVEHLVHSMRHIFRNRGEARQVGLLARADMLDNWSWERAAAAASARLQALGAQGSLLPARPLAAAGQQAAIPAAPTQAMRIHWEGSQLVHHSMALINREICWRLAANESIELSIIPDEPHVFEAGADARLQALVARINQPLNGEAQVHVRHQYPPSFAAPPAGHWVMIQPWEFGSLPQKWIEEMRAAVDEVWVPSHYLRECYIASGMPADRVAVVPNGVDVDCFQPDAPPLNLNAWTNADTQLAAGTFKFLFVGGTIWRKGPDILLAAYKQAFTRADDVCLVIKDLPFYEGFQWTERIRAMQADPLAARILYLNHNLQPSELPGLYTAADCLVYPTRGEGFGLPIAEAMACGLPVIVPAAGAPLDFCNADTAYLIPAPRQDFPVERIEDLQTAGVPFLHEPDVQATAALMRAAYENRAAAQATGRKARAAIVAQFTWEHVAAQVQVRLQAVSARPVVRFQVAPPALPAIFVAQPHGAALAAAALSRHAAGSLQLYAVGARSASDLQPAAVPPGAACSAAPVAQLLNQLIRHTNAPAIVMLSSDAALEPQALQQLCAALAADANLALVAPAAHALPPEPAAGQPAATLAVRSVASACVVFNTQVCRGLAPLREDIAFHVAFWEYLAHIQQSDKKVGLAMHINMEHDTLTTLEGAQYATLEAIDTRLGAVLGECQQWLDTGDYATALPGLREVTLAMPEFAAGHAALGAVLLKLQDPAASTAALRTATQLDPDSAIYWNQLGVAQHAAGDLGGAAQAFEQAHSADPADIQSLLNLIELRRAQDDIAAASTLVKQALQQDPTNAEVLAAFADLCLELDDLEGMRLGLQRLGTVAPGHPALASLQAAAAARQAQTAATPDLEAQLLEMLALGKQCIDRGDYTTAIEAFTGLTLTLPGLAAGHTALGTTLLAKGDAHAAIPALARAVQLAPDEPGLHNQLGVAMYQVGQAAEAAEQFQAALQIAPQNLDAMLNMVELERARANYDAATHFAHAALKTDPNHPDVLLVFGSLSLELGDAEGAGLALRRLEKTQPSHPAVGQLGAALAAHQPAPATLEELPYKNGTHASNGTHAINGTAPYANGKHTGNGTAPYTNGKH